MTFSITNELVCLCRHSTDLLKRLFWTAATATHTSAHGKAMKSIERLSKSAHELLSKQDLKVWTKAYFSTPCQADNVDNNMTECFNAWIINER